MSKHRSCDGLLSTLCAVFEAPFFTMNLSPSIPFAEQLRRKRKRTSSNSSSEPVTQPVLDVDDEIARLERELEIIDSDSDSDSGYSSSSSSAYLMLIYDFKTFLYPIRLALARQYVRVSAATS